MNYENIAARDRGSSKGFRGISGNLDLLPKYRIRKWRFIKKRQGSYLLPQSILANVFKSVVYSEVRNTNEKLRQKSDIM